MKFSYYKYLVILFRLTNILVSFKRFIKEVLHKYLYLFIIVYLDDILIFLIMLEEYIKYISKVL